VAILSAVETVNPAMTSTLASPLSRTLLYFQSI